MTDERRRRREDLGAWRRPLNRLVLARMARRRDVVTETEKRGEGGRATRREHLYFLDDGRRGETLIAAARACGVKGAKRAKAAYGRGGLPGRHTKVRNDFFVKLIEDALEANRRSGRTIIEVPLEEAWGQTCPDFPILGAKITADGAGRALTGFDLARAGYEEIEPDMRFLIRLPETGLSCFFDVELEMGIRTKEVIHKVDARAAAYACMYADRERFLAKKAGHPGVPWGEWAGLPPGMVPVVFLFPTGRQARSMRDRVAGAEEGLERFDAFGEKVARFGLSLGALFLFAGLDELGVYDEEPRGRTLVGTYATLAPLDPQDAATRDRQGLANVAAYRQRFVAAAPRSETQA